MILAILSVIFPENLEYFEDFLSGLNNQTDNNFLLILGNDGCSENQLHLILGNYDINYVIISLEGMTPIGNRIALLNYAKGQDIDYISFGDTDDYFSKDKVRSVFDMHEKGDADIVINELVMISSDGDVVSQPHWIERLSKLDLDYKALLGYNFLGLGNTTIKKKLIEKEFTFSKDIKAFDWMFYIQILHRESGSLNICFSDAITYYRQHTGNILGLKPSFTKEQLLKSIKLKSQFMEFCVSIGITEAKTEFSSLRKLKKALDNEAFADKYIFKINQRKNLFWFEETTL